ncbi:MAG TPA: DUF1475 family protein [Kiritimatiellia bacterium]|nr:DUF1475 family protein [Kiritimatiellia bacterium]
MNTKQLLQLIFGLIIAGMLWVTTRASLDRGVFTAAGELMGDPWFLATLFDAYFGFLTFYVWVFYKEATLAGRLIWFFLIMALGNFAMAFYVLRELHRLAPGQPVSAILLRRTA